MGKHFKSKRRAYRRKGAKKSRRVGKKLTRSIKKVVRSMETLKRETEVGCTDIPQAAQLVLAQHWNRCIPKIYVGTAPDQRQYYTVKPTRCYMDIFLRFAPLVSFAESLTITFLMLKGKQRASYTSATYNGTGFQNYADYLMADGQTTAAFVQNTGDIISAFKAETYPINTTTNVLLKRKVIHMRKGLGCGDNNDVTWNYQPPVRSETAGGYLSSGPAQIYTPSVKFRVSIPVPQRLNYELISAATSDQTKAFPTDFAPVWGIAIRNDVTGSFANDSIIYMSYVMNMHYKDL